jgi:hypothetical protein
MQLEQDGFIQNYCFCGQGVTDLVADGSFIDSYAFIPKKLSVILVILLALILIAIVIIGFTKDT